MPRPILTAAETRSAEAALFAAGVTPLELANRAAVMATRAIRAFTGPIPALVLCGRGNNGADGYLVASALRDAEWPVRVAVLGEPSTELARRARALWTGPVEDATEAAPAELLVDALFGIGLSRALEPACARTIDRLAGAAGVRAALDLPSGVEADSGALLGAVPSFDMTIAFGALKPAHVLRPAASRCGRVIVADIGLGIAKAGLTDNPRPLLPRPSADAHKYSRGALLVLTGSRARTGAARLAAAAGLAAGAGAVTLAVPDDAIDEAAGQVGAVMVRPLDVEHLRDGRTRAVVVGPGLGLDRPEVVRAVLASGLPAVLDGDALRIVGDPARIGGGACVLTPHEGEFVALFGDLRGSRVERARAAARQSGCVVVLKGPDTVIAAADGRARVNAHAAPWLATAGSGDTLAGIIGALLAQGWDAFEAASAGVWIHGDIGVRGGPGLTADAMAGLLPTVLADLA